MMNRIFQLALVAFGALLLFAGMSMATPRSASAQQVNVTVTVIVASNDGAGADASLSSHARRLQQQFSQFNSFRQSTRERLALTPGQSGSVALPGARAATVLLEGQRNGTILLQVQVPGGSTDIRLPPGGTIFLAGTPVTGGTAILMIQT